MIVVKCVLFWGGLVSKYKGFVGCKKKGCVSFHFILILFWHSKKTTFFRSCDYFRKKNLKKNYSLSWNKGKHQKIWNRHNLNKVSPAKPKYCWGNISILVLWIRWHLSVISNNHFYSFLFQFLILFVFSNHFMLNFLSYILGKLGNIQNGG